MSVPDAGNILSQITLINSKYKAIARTTRENFNVFQILGVERYEVRTHSAFIKELLDVNGRHDCDDFFLKIFIEQQIAKNLPDTIINKLSGLNTNRSFASVEEHIGFISKDGEQGGRIDILVKDNCNNAFIIENKIDAGDQSKQLIRYRNAYENAPIFYLTLDGRSPEKHSKGELREGVDFVCISYHSDILEWLESCLKETAKYPSLREAIAQYINLIKHLTHQSIYNQMEKEIIDLIIRDEETFKTAKHLRTSLNQLEDKVQRVCEEEILNQWKIRFNYDWELPLFDYGIYTFYCKLSFEGKRWHTDIWPWKGHKVFGCANDSEVQKFKGMLKLYDQKVDFDNHNYSAWFYSPISIEKLPFERYSKLLDDSCRRQWALELIEEAEKIIRFFMNTVKDTLDIEDYVISDLVKQHLPKTNTTVL